MIINRRILVNIFLSFFCFLLSACTGLSTTQPNHLTQKPIQSTTSTNTFTKTTEIETPSSTYTIAAVQINSISKTPSPSNTSTKIVAATSTTSPKIALKETQIARFSAACEDNTLDVSLTLVSTDGNWLAVPCGHIENQTLKVYNKTGKKWEFKFADYIDKHFLQYGQPSGGLYPIKWTKDDKYLYFVSSLAFDGGGTCFYGGNGQGLYRLKIENGTVEATLPPLRGADEYLISFSPSGRWLAYNTGIPTILDLQTGEKIILQEGNNSVGGFTWSPDGSKLAYSTCQPSEDNSIIKRSSVQIFSLKTRESKTILDNKTQNVFFWTALGDDNRLKIYNMYTNGTGYSFFDWSTEILTTSTPISAP